jgi:hypothetical protein
MTHKVIWGEERVTVRYFDKASDTEIITAVEDLQTDDRFEKITQALHDFNSCECIEHYPVTVGEIAALHIDAPSPDKRLKIAIVCNNPAIKQMLQFFDDFGHTPFPIDVFPTCAHAETWLSPNQRSS